MPHAVSSGANAGVCPDLVSDGWFELVHADHHQSARIHLQYGAAHDGTHLHRGGHTCYRQRVVLGQGRQAEPVRARFHDHRGPWLLHVRMPLEADDASPPVRENWLIVVSRCISSGDPKVIYGGVFLGACGLYPAFPGIISWLSNNLAGSYKRGVGMALQIGAGNLGGVSVLRLGLACSCRLTVCTGIGSQLLQETGCAPVRHGPRDIVGARGPGNHRCCGSHRMLQGE